MGNDLKTIAVPVTVTAGAAVNVQHMGTKTVQVTGTFVATVQIQGSLDNVNWVNEGAAFTAPGKIDVTSRWAFMRANTTAFTSGTPAARLCGETD